MSRETTSIEVLGHYSKLQRVVAAAAIAGPVILAGCSGDNEGLPTTNVTAEPTKKTKNTSKTSPTPTKSFEELMTEAPTPLPLETETTDPEATPTPRPEHKFDDYSQRRSTIPRTISLTPGDYICVAEDNINFQPRGDDMSHDAIIKPVFVQSDEAVSYVFDSYNEDTDTLVMERRPSEDNQFYSINAQDIGNPNCVQEEYQGVAYVSTNNEEFEVLPTTDEQYVGQEIVVDSYSLEAMNKYSIVSAYLPALRYDQTKDIDPSAGEYYCPNDACARNE